MVPEPAPTEPTTAAATTAQTEAKDEGEIDFIAAADRMLTEAEIDDTYVSDRELARLTDAGMTTELATSALEILAQRCKDVRTPTCGHVGREEVMREALVEWLRDHGELSSAPVLLRLSHYGDYMAESAIEAMLTRRMQASLSPCSPPTEAEVAATRAELSSFVVVEQQGAQLSGRAATADELDDLAYFLTAIAENGAGAGEIADEGRSGRDLTEDEKLDRAHHVAALEHAQGTGDHALIVQAGSDYLHTLGYPGPIDLSRETDMFWGGARFSYVMRDVALSAEIEEQPELAAALYRRANPAGGMCGTSVAARLDSQSEGLIRTEEAQGQCRAVVVQRLLHGDPKDAYGPHRLAEAGYDIERLYRGALVTRHRDRPLDELAAAIERAPAAVREAGIVRLRDRGPESWESRLWTVERLAAMTGRAGMHEMLTMVEHADPELRARLVSAIGESGERGYLGTCDPDRFSLTLRGRSGGPPSIRAFGEDCGTWLTDAEADAVAKQLLPYLRDDSTEVRAATARALGYLAAPSARAPLARVADRAGKDHRRCEARDGDECWRFRDIRDNAQEALETMEQYAEDATRDPLDGWDFSDEDAPEDDHAALGPLEAPPAMQRTTEDIASTRG